MLNRILLAGASPMSSRTTAVRSPPATKSWTSPKSAYTFGNIAVRSFVIDIHAQAHAGDPMQVTQVFNYPNPFEGTTYIHARLNQGGRIHVGIFTVAGRRVRDLAVDGRAGENYLPWDGKDSQGENVAIGVYLLRVTAESPEGKRASVVGRALRRR